MIGGIILLVLLFVITLPVLQRMKRKHTWFSPKLMRGLYWYHMLFASVYYIFALSNPSDSVGYFERPQTHYDTWFSAFNTGTPFIDFLGYPFINYLHFSYEMMMVMFAWLGYWGFIYFYIFFKENTRYKHFFQGIDLITLLIFLPNMHYWTASLGKGSIIFFGLGMSIYGLSRLNTRKIALVMGMLVIYLVRPHVFLFMAVSIVVGLFTGRQKVPLYQKMLVFGGSIVALYLLYDQIMAFANIDSDNILESLDQFSEHRAVELAKAGSGLDTSSYPLVLKLFTFWFRPLFVDAPGPVGLIVSFENLFYLILTVKLFQSGFIRFLRKSTSLVKTSAVLFLGTSYALAGALSNLGIIIRQKSMVMYFFLFIILSFLDYKKNLRVVKKQKALEKKGSQSVQLT